MNLYVWQPNGHGEYSFFVMAESVDAARTAVNSYIANHLNKADDHHLSDRDVHGWGTDYYHLRVLQPGEVITNSND